MRTTAIALTFILTASAAFAAGSDGQGGSYSQGSNPSGTVNKSTAGPNPSPWNSFMTGLTGTGQATFDSGQVQGAYTNGQLGHI